MESFKVAPELLEVVAWRNPEILVGGRVVDHLELSEEAAFEIWRNVPRMNVANEECAQPRVPKADDHAEGPGRASVPLNGSPFGGLRDEQVYLRDTLARTTTRVSVGNDGPQGNDISSVAAVSATGRYVLFSSYASNLAPGPSDGKSQVFVRDTIAGTTTQVSLASDGSRVNDHAGGVSVSSDGRYVAFTSAAPNIVPGDTNGVSDIFVRDTVAGTTARVSVNADGLQASGGALAAEMTPDGRYVAWFWVGSRGFPVGIFVRDTTNGTTTRASVAADGTPASGTGTHSVSAQTGVTSLSRRATAATCISATW